MNGFVCIVNRSGTEAQPLEERWKSRLRGFGGESRWIDADGAAAAVFGTRRQPAQVIRVGQWSAAGVVRLDNRADLIAKLVGATTASPSDLELALRVVIARGTRGVQELLGDFGFVAYNRDTRKAVAARDPFGVCALYMRRQGTIAAFASRASVLALDDRYDDEFLADFLLIGGTQSEHTIYAGVEAVAPGTVIMVSPDGVRSERFWDPESYAEQTAGDFAHAPEKFRSLFEVAVRARVGAEGGVTWGHLSGGLDSSSVVCVTQLLAERGILPHGLAGTVTMVDSLGSGDEREYSDLVVSRHRLANQQFANGWVWEDDGLAPPNTDEPTMGFPLYASARRVVTFVDGSGCRAMLSGLGSDHYLTGNLLFLADELSRGHFSAAGRLLLEWSVREKTSAWKLAYHNALYPLLPRRVRTVLPNHSSGVPPWVAPTFARRNSLRSRLQPVRETDAPWGHKYNASVLFQLRHLPGMMDRGITSDAYETRYPFLYRPLVEFALSLPASLRTRPRARKWILREAMRGILPEPIRTRPSKGGVGGRVIWAMRREHDRLAALLRAPVLADLGAIDVRAARETLDRIRSGAERLKVKFLITLALESWLAVRHGVWPTINRTETDATTALAGRSDMTGGRHQLLNGRIAVTTRHSGGGV